MSFEDAREPLQRLRLTFTYPMKTSVREKIGASVFEGRQILDDYVSLSNFRPV